MAHGLEAEYTVTVSARTPNASGVPTVTEIDELKPIGSLSYADDLYSEGEASLSVEPENLVQDIADRFKNLRATPCEINIFRNDDKMWCGPLLSAQVQGPTLSLNARGLLYYLRYMTLESDLLYTSLTDQYTIGKGLVDAYQVLPYGNYGIDTSSIGTSGITRIRSYPFRENQNVFERLTELAEVDQGFDLWIDPTTRQLVFVAMKGTDKTDTVFADSSNIDNPNVFWSVASDDIASEGIAVGVDDDGATPAVVGVKSNAAVRESWGRATAFTTAEDVTTQFTIDGYAQRLIDARNDQLFVPGPSVVPVVDGEPTDFETGDTITYSIRIGNLGLMNVERRVKARRVTVEEDGTEVMDLELV